MKTDRNLFKAYTHLRINAHEFYDVEFFPHLSARCILNPFHYASNTQIRIQKLQKTHRKRIEFFFSVLIRNFEQGVYKAFKSDPHYFFFFFFSYFGARSKQKLSPVSPG